VIRHLLLDADGVLQTIPGGGQVGRAGPYLGARSAELVDQLWAAEQPALRGDGDMELALRGILDRHGIEVDPDELYAELWLSIRTVPAMVDLVRRARAAGYGVHLGTNQHRQRAAYMRETLGYDDLFDVSCYSCDLGAAKPEVAYFRRAAARIGDDPASVLFVDDLAGNVAGARAAGLRAEQWDLESGLPRLVELLADHGVHV